MSTSDAPIEVPRDWDECGVPGCGGACIDESTCLKHADDQIATNAVMRGFFDLRGVEVDQELIDRLLPFSGSSIAGRRAMGRGLFQHARLSEVSFRAVQFDRLDLSAAQFTGLAAFRDVVVDTRVLLPKSVFAQGLSIADSAFAHGLLGGECDLGDVMIRNTQLGPTGFFRFEAGMVSFADLRGATQIVLTNARLNTLGIQRCDDDVVSSSGRSPAQADWSLPSQLFGTRTWCRLRPTRRSRSRSASSSGPLSWPSRLRTWLSARPRS
jgi:uncharacterized protein YjbI with pentapeptide repeats